MISPLENSGEAGPLQKQSSDSSDELVFLTPVSSIGYAEPGIQHLGMCKLSSFYSGQRIDQLPDQSPDEFISSLQKDHDAVVTLEDIADFVSYGIDANLSPGDYSWEMVTAKTSNDGPLFDSATSLNDDRAWKLTRTVYRFIKECDPEQIRELVDRHDADMTLHVLADAFLNHFSGTTGGFVAADFDDDFTNERAFFAGLELLALGINNAKDLVPVTDAHCGVVSQHVEAVCERVLEMMAKSERQRFDLLLVKAHECYAGHRAKFKSSTADEETNGNLPSAIKAELFKNAVRELEQAGVLIAIPAVDLNGNLVAMALSYKRVITWTKGDMQRTRDFFEVQEGFSVDYSLLAVLRGCIRVHVENSTGAHNFAEKGFHAERGVLIPFLFKHLEIIARELRERYGFDYRRRIYSSHDRSEREKENKAAHAMMQRLQIES